MAWVRDTSLKDYFNKPEHFADVFNKSYFDGQQIIRPEALHEWDSSIRTQLDSIFGEKNVEHFPDLVKALMKDDEPSVLLALAFMENQVGVDYAMPLREMTNLCIACSMQLQQLKTKRREDRSIYKASSEELRSGILKTDRICLVLPLTIYWGTAPWDGPKTLKDMMHIPDNIPDDLREHLPDFWTLNLLEARLGPEQLADPANQALFGAVLCDADRTQKLKDRIRGVMEICMPHANDELLIHTIATVLQHEKLEEQVREIAGGKTMEAVVDTWEQEFKAEGKAEGKTEGEAKGIIETARDYSASDDAIIRQLRKKLGWDDTKAARALQEYDRTGTILMDA